MAQILSAIWARSEKMRLVLERPPASDALVTDFDSLQAEIERMRTRGYATLDDELERGVVGASAPVFDALGVKLVTLHKLILFWVHENRVTPRQRCHAQRRNRRR